MNQISIDKMELLSGGRVETDNMGCSGVILLGAVLTVVSLGWGFFFMGVGLGICASESQK